tara:strand:- start:174 stop:599 length:426 start_codon:yes stop_codon:yes gene_type:complete
MTEEIYDNTFHNYVRENVRKLIDEQKAEKKKQKKKRDKAGKYAETIYNFKSTSDKSIDAVIRKHGDTSVRLEVQMLHPDDMKVCSIYLKKLASDLDAMANSRETNVHKIFSARWFFSACNKEIQHACQYNMLYAQDNTVIK